MEEMNTEVLVPRRATLDGFVQETSEGQGVHVQTLEPLTTLRVSTRNTVYRITVSRGASIYVQGGRFFPSAQEGRLEGASSGRGLLKLGWIGVGFCMEIVAGGQRVVTSPVRAIATEPATSIN